MALRSNHYDAAFEAYLREARTPYIAVDENRRALLQDASLKSMDFIVYSNQPHNLLVEVKGRKFPSGDVQAGHLWENWATTDDLTGLQTWQRVFGAPFRALLVFAYHVVEERWLAHHRAWVEFRDRHYAFYGVWADQYQAAMRSRSSKWETVWLPAADFQALRAPIRDFL